MWSTVVTVIHQIWSLLPYLTTGLQFLTALIGFIAALPTPIRRKRRLLAKQSTAGRARRRRPRSRTNSLSSR
jgi:hypothetical protein